MIQKFFPRLILLFKMYIDRRSSRGMSDWRFHWKFGGKDAEYHVIEVISRAGRDRSVLRMRRGSTDLFTFEQVFCNNDYSLRRLARWQEIVETYDSKTRAGVPLILDLGANSGMATAYFRLTWPAAHIVAVEPDKGNFEVLQLNTEKILNVECVNAAVASTDGKVRIVNPDAEAWAIRTELASPGESEGAIRAVSIATLLQEKRLQGFLPFICKIDIEGFELELFSKNTDWIDEFPVVVIELHDWMMPRMATSNSFLRAIACKDRDFIYIGENVFSIQNSPKR